MSSLHTTTRIVLAGLLALFLTACDHGHDHDSEHANDEDGGHVHGETGAHGGALLDLDPAGHAEVVHDHDTGTVTVHLTGPDAATALVPSTPPVLKLVTADGPRLLTMQATDDNATFTITDDALAVEELDGRLTVAVDGKTYNPQLEHAH